VAAIIIGAGASSRANTNRAFEFSITASFLAEAKGRYGFGFEKMAFYDLDSMKGSARPRTGDLHFTPTMLDLTKELRILRLP
jgi:hypothetical protein